jgi:hypothetical protein
MLASGRQFGRSTRPMREIVPPALEMRIQNDDIEEDTG